MNKSKLGILMLGALVFSANTFAGTISSQEQNMRNTVTKCINDIQQSEKAGPIDGKTVLDVIYGTSEGAHKYCSSAADKTRSAITPGYNQQEQWDAEFLELFEEYGAIPKEDANKPYALNMLKKIRALAAPSKLDGRHAQSKLYVYRAMMQELDKLDALLPSIEGQ
ncbi:hypothetical protein [Serratia silvae]|uniref:Uncharacterized protein n=1 Tax=Serratia silvae TaxID=2824122 RepID=A0ABT0K6Y3_9GAMM|nr:hypothetical protein [Serratia silvae]MCL1027514.1 hypothetical protein [Serratia silvae]